MKRHTTQQLLAWLALVAYAASGSGLASQFVYCIGSDGHSAIERVHVAGPCHASGESAASAAVITTPDWCTDLPLLIQAAREGERLGGTRPIQYVATTAYVPDAPPSRSRPRSTSDLAFTLQGTVSRKTTVLRV